MSEASAPKRVTRRTVAKGAAWTVPAIVVAMPAASASTSAPSNQEPGDHCYRGGYAGNAWQFYVQQPSQVGDTITISGPAMTDGSRIHSGCGITVVEVSDTGAGEDRVVVYEITAVNADVPFPFVIIEGNNSSAGRDLSIVQDRDGTEWDWTAFSNSPNCNSIGTPNCSVALTPAG